MLILKKALYLLTRSFRKIRLCNRNPWLSDYKIGDWSYGEPKVLKWNSDSKLSIGRFCSIGGNVTIFLDGEHQTDWISTYPFYAVTDSAHDKCNIVSKGAVHIGNDVWIGEGATILSGVSIGNGSVIGANAVISTDVPPFAIVAGNPAKLIKSRFTGEEIDALERIKWWDWPIEKINMEMSLIASADISGFISKHDPKSNK